MLTHSHAIFSRRLARFTCGYCVAFILVDFQISPLSRKQLVSGWYRASTGPDLSGLGRTPNICFYGVLSYTNYMSVTPPPPLQQLGDAQSLVRFDAACTTYIRTVFPTPLHWSAYKFHHLFRIASTSSFVLIQSIIQITVTHTSTHDHRIQFTYTDLTSNTFKWRGITFKCP